MYHACVYDVVMVHVQISSFNTSVWSAHYGGLGVLNFLCKEIGMEKVKNALGGGGEVIWMKTHVSDPRIKF